MHPDKYVPVKVFIKEAREVNECYEEQAKVEFCRRAATLREGLVANYRAGLSVSSLFKGLVRCLTRRSGVSHLK